MGLDVTLVKVPKGIELTWDNYGEVATELAYGRKCWEICHWFNAASASDGIYQIKSADWNKFDVELDKIGDDLDAARSITLSSYKHVLV